MPTKASLKTDRNVSVTVSLPISVVSQVQDEALVMGRGFSDAVAVLLQIGIDIRKNQRQQT